MDNEKLLNKRWKYTEECLNKHLSEYKKLNAKTQDKIQDIFNNVKFTFNDLNKPITKAQKNKFLRVIEEWKDKKILIGYLEYKVKTLISQNIITNGELLDILIYGALCEERIELEKKENDLFINIGNNLYNQAIEEIKITKPKYKHLSITWEYIYSLLIIPNTKGYQWKAYIEAMALSNSQEITRQAIIFLQQNKDLDINDDIFQNILRKQQNKYLSINDDIDFLKIADIISWQANTPLTVAEILKNVIKINFSK